MGPVRQPLFSGTAPALVTPFTADGSAIDEAAFRSLIEYQIEGSRFAGRLFEGVEALVVLGTTGENPTVTHAERRHLVDVALDQAAGRVPVIVGTGTNDTASSIAYSTEAATAGADGLLVVGPYYNKPTPDGVVAHVASIADATDCPIVLYNVPGRTGSNLTAETTLRVLEDVPTVVGVKEASGDLGQIADIIAHAPDGVAVYSGDDDLAFPTVCLGGSGLISVISNAAPGPIAEMIRRALAGDLEGARALHYALLDAMRASFVESNPTPLKAVLAAQGRMEAAVRQPLAPLSESGSDHVFSAYADLIEAGAVPASA